MRRRWHLVRHGHKYRYWHLHIWGIALGPIALTWFDLWGRRYIVEVLIGKTALVWD